MVRNYFTLMEVMVATLILTLGIVASVSVIGTAQARVTRAQNQRNRQHLLTLVTECYLMGGPDVVFPGGMLPAGYSASCELFQVDDLNDEAIEPYKKWVLGEFWIQLFDGQGVLIGENRVRKMLREEDLGLEDDLD